MLSVKNPGYKNGVVCVRGGGVGVCVGGRGEIPRIPTIPKSLYRNNGNG